jgi:hypothetical protein
VDGEVDDVAPPAWTGARVCRADRATTRAASWCATAVDLIFFRDADGWQAVSGLSYMRVVVR